MCLLASPGPACCISSNCRKLASSPLSSRCASGCPQAGSLLLCAWDHCRSPEAPVRQRNPPWMAQSRIFPLGDWKLPARDPQKRNSWLAIQGLPCGALCRMPCRERDGEATGMTTTQALAFPVPPASPRTEEIGCGQSREGGA